MYYKLLLRFITGILVCVVILTGCANDSATTTESQILPTATTPSEEGLTGDSYPAPQLEDVTSGPGYPAPELAENATQDVPQPELPLQLVPSEVGATVGGVVVDRISQQVPPESLVYLGAMKYTETGFPVVSLNRQEASFVVLPSNGAFIFENVEPGEYALVFFTPDYSFLVEKAEGESMIFTVEEGDVLDLGTLLIDAR